MSFRTLFVVIAFAVAAVAVALLPDAGIARAGQKKKAPADADGALAAVRLADKDLKVELWATEPLLANPVAFAFDEQGRCFVVETFRHTQGVPDVRGKPYTDDDIASRSVADRLAMYKKYKVGPYPENSERLRLVWDSDGDGKADKDSVFADGFNRPEDGIAAGVLARKGDVYFTCIPDLYLLRDPKGENRATEKKSLATGFGVRVQYIGHDLHGLRMGPDGKLYMSIGDRGLNVITKEGKKLFNPDSGAVLRCDPDGSNLEIVHVGLRNPQELAFDDYGNLFTWDNNSDSGDQARWVLVVEGGDSGWRCGFQHGTSYDVQPASDKQGNRGPWNTEKLWRPQWDGQPAYIVPPLLNFGNGPSGITHYPGVGLNDKYKDHFFCTDFTGGPGGNSAIWTLSVKPKGAAFEVVGKPQKFITQMLPTDCEFGPDGAFYWSDWTTGWDKPGKGRIFRVTDPEAMKNPAVAEAKKLIAEGFGKKSVEELAKLLEFPHQQVRQEAQFELASRKSEDAVKALASVLKDSKNRVARLHAVWGLAMIAREMKSTAFLPLLELQKESDPEIRRAIGEHLRNLVTADREGPAVRTWLKELLSDPDARVKAAAAVAYGKMKWTGFSSNYYGPLFDLLKSNDDKDPYLRHAVVLGLVYSARTPTDVWDVAWRVAKDKYDVPSVRMGVLLALRKGGSAKVAEFLNDSEPRIVAEAARAVYDERIKDALPALAKLAEKSGQTDAVAYRALAANFWGGTADDATRVARFAARAGEPDYARVFALKLLADWTSPPRRDPITGLTMNIAKRDAEIAAGALKAAGPTLFTGSDAVRREATSTAAKLGVKEFGAVLAAMVKDAKNPAALRADALFAAEALKEPATKELVALALASDDPQLRAAGRAVKAKLEPAAVLGDLPYLLKDEKLSLPEKQGAFAILAKAGASESVDKLLDEWLDAALAGKVSPEIVLDVLDAAEVRSAAKIKVAASLKQKVEKYRSAQTKVAAEANGDKLAPYLESLVGGDADRGRSIFLNNSAVYCQRCHKLDGQGGDVGPQLNGIAADKDHDRRYLLESVVLPSAKIAKGFDTVILVLQDERTVSGIVKSEDKKQIKLVTPENKEVVVAVEDVASRRTGPSAMPADLHTKLSRRELRDLVEFLTSLKEPPKK